MPYKKHLSFLILPIFLALFPSCFLFHDSNAPVSDDEAIENADENQDVIQDNQPAATGKTRNKKEIDRINLRLAQLWTRIDDLELKTNKTLEAQKVIEKSLLLGITPKSLSTSDYIPPTQQELENTKEETSESSKQGEQNKEAPGNNSIEEFESSFAQALSYYRSGDFGKAVVELNHLRKTYGDDIKDGIHLYWLGKCWVSLNDYSAAERHLLEFIEKFPASALIPRAKLDLARAKYRGGKAKQAITLLKSIINDYPEDDIGEMARLELERQRRN